MHLMALRAGIKPVHYRDQDIICYYRRCAAFAEPNIYHLLEIEDYIRGNRHLR
jgi:hypothetical protein